MEFKELKTKTDSQLDTILRESREELRALRFKVLSKQEKNVRMLRLVRKRIAWILMLLQEKKKGS